MIQKIMNVSSVQDTLRYVLNERDRKGRMRPRCDIVESVMAAKTPLALSKEFAVIASFRPMLARNAFHSSIRKSPDDRFLTDQEWSKITVKYMQALGFDSYLSVCHGDHIHIVATRIDFSGNTISDSNDFKRGEAILREIEVDLGLVRVRSSHLFFDGHWCRPDVCSPTRREVEAAARRSEEPPRKIVQSAILKSIDEASPIDIEEFEKRLRLLGIGLRRGRSKNNKPYLLFVFRDRNYGVHKLGNLFSLAELSKRGLQITKAEIDCDVQPNPINLPSGPLNK